MIPLIKLSGSYYDMGHKYGAMFSSEIHEFAAARLNRIKNFVKRYGKVDVSEESVIETAGSLLNIHENYDSNTWQEFIGIADGAKISSELLLILNSYTDLRDLITKKYGFNDLEVRYEGCTSFILDKTMTSDGQITMGQTWDMSVEAMKYLVIVEKSPENGPKMLYLTTKGCLALIGMNEHGISLGTTNLMANDTTEGLSYLFIINKALQANNVQKIKQQIINTTRLSGHSYLILDNSQAILLETSARLHQEYKLDYLPLVHTNHYSRLMQPNQIFIPQEKLRNSVYRQSRAMSILAASDNWDKQSLWHEVLSDQYKDSYCMKADNKTNFVICNEDYTSQYSEFATCATVIMQPASMSLWVCEGGAKTGELQQFTLE